VAAADPAVFFALGWIAARIDIKHLLRESRALPLSYFRGLNFLLNEQPDKAIESFIEVVKVDPQTIDLHFALGSLFRRQGEIDRAIRMHQNLLDRPDLPADKRERRPSSSRRTSTAPACSIAPRSSSPSSTARRSSIRRSASCCRSTSRRRTGRRRSPSRADGIAREAAVLQGDRALRLRARAGRAAQERLRGGARLHRQALGEYKACARATMLLGDAHAQEGDDDEAIAAWQRVETQNPAFLSLVAERLADGYRRTSRPAQGLRVLRSYQSNIRRSIC
jgi:lipopolysaccharide biosynthesis regulator YciM